MLAGAAIGLRFALPEFKSLNLDPLNRFNEPLLELDLKPRSGPIVVMNRLRNRREDIPEFLKRWRSGGVSASATEPATGR